MPTVGDRGAEPSGDAALVERILADPTAGWADAWDRYGHRLHSYCRRKLDDPNEADDAVSDVFLVASQRIGSLREPEAFRAWMYAIARRRIQETWRNRQRTTPVDPQGEAIVTATTPEMELGGGAEAAELVAAAATSLSERDRDLLDLALGSDLDTGEIARITGESVSFVSVRVTRLKERVGRSAGALLIARHHRRDCEKLERVLAGWDGTFDKTWRNRVARHVDGCDGCSRRRHAATAVFAAPLLFAAPAGALRSRALEQISSSRAVAPDLGPWDDTGFPAGTGGRRKWPILAGVGGALVAVLLALVGLGVLDGDDSTVVAGDSVTIDPVATTEISTASSTSSTTTSSTTTSSTTVAVPVTSAPAVDPGRSATPTTATTPPTVDTSETTTTTETTLAPAPTVTLSLSPTSIWVGLPEPGFDVQSQATVTVDAPAGGATTTVSWDGTEPGSVTVAGAGTHTVLIGHFTTVQPNETVTVTAATTDAAGRTATTSAPLRVIGGPI